MSRYQHDPNNLKNNFGKEKSQLSDQQGQEISWRRLEQIEDANEQQNKFSMVCECGQKFKTTSALTDHIYLVHNPEKCLSRSSNVNNERTILMLKKRRFKTSYQLQKYIERGHTLQSYGIRRRRLTKRKDGITQFRKIYICGACEIKYHLAEELRFHILTIHHGVVPDGTIYGINRDQILKHFKISQNQQVTYSLGYHSVCNDDEDVPEETTNLPKHHEKQQER